MVASLNKIYTMYHLPFIAFYEQNNKNHKIQKTFKHRAEGFFAVYEVYLK